MHVANGTSVSDCVCCSLRCQDRCGCMLQCIRRSVGIAIGHKRLFVGADAIECPDFGQSLVEDRQNGSLNRHGLAVPVILADGSQSDRSVCFETADSRCGRVVQDEIDYQTSCRDAGVLLDAERIAIDVCTKTNQQYVWQREYGKRFWSGLVCRSVGRVCRGSPLFPPLAFSSRAPPFLSFPSCFTLVSARLLPSAPPSPRLACCVRPSCWVFWVVFSLLSSLALFFFLFFFLLCFFFFFFFFLFLLGHIW